MQQKHTNMIACNAYINRTRSHGRRNTDGNISCWLSHSKNKNGDIYFTHIYVYTYMYVRDVKKLRRSCISGPGT